MEIRLLFKELIQTVAITYSSFFLYGIWLGNFKTKNKSTNIVHKFIFGIALGIIATIFFYFNYKSDSNILVLTGVLTIFVTAFLSDIYGASIVYIFMLYNRLVILNENFSAILFIYLILVVLLGIIAKYKKKKDLNKWLIMMITGLSFLILELIILNESFIILIFYIIAYIILGITLYLLFLFVVDTNNMYLKFYKYSMKDYLTKLYNRRKFDYDFNEIKKSDFKSISIAYFDVDNFKRINDSYGHNTGDFVLETISGIMIDSCDKNINAYRLSGEEFCIIILNSDISSNKELITSIQNKIKNYPFEAIYNKNDDFYEEFFVITASCGLVHYTDKSIDINLLLEKADKAMYEAKNKGINMLVEYQY